MTQEKETSVHHLDPDPQVTQVTGITRTCAIKATPTLDHLAAITKQKLATPINNLIAAAMALQEEMRESLRKARPTSSQAQPVELKEELMEEPAIQEELTVEHQTNHMQKANPMALQEAQLTHPSARTAQVAALLLEELQLNQLAQIPQALVQLPLAMMISDKTDQTPTIKEAMTTTEFR